MKVNGKNSTNESAPKIADVVNMILDLVALALLNRAQNLAPTHAQSLALAQAHLALAQAPAADTTKHSNQTNCFKYMNMLTYSYIRS